MDPSPIEYIWKAISRPKAQGTLHDSGWKDSKNQKIESLL